MITTTTVKQEYKDRVTAEINRCLDIARAKWPTITFNMPNIVYRQMGRKAGLAYCSYNRIELNADFFNNGHLEDMINQTGPHELAHLITHLVYGSAKLVRVSWQRRAHREGPKSHGWEWKNVMRVLGKDPDRCHDYSLDGVKVKGGITWEYTCKCGQIFNLSRTLHTRISMGQDRRCCKCKGSIFLKSGSPSPVVSATVVEKTPINLVQQIIDIPMPKVSQPFLVSNNGEITVPRDWE